VEDKAMQVGCLFGMFLTFLGYLGVIGVLILSLLFGFLGINQTVTFPPPVEATLQGLEATMTVAAQTLAPQMTPTSTPSNK
jgi:hypothetical protein